MSGFVGRQHELFHGWRFLMTASCTNFCINDLENRRTQTVKRREIWRVMVLPQAVVGVIVSLICFLIAGELAAKSAAVGSVIVIIASFAGGFIALGPYFDRVGFLLARIMLGTFLKIIIALFLFAVMLKGTSLLPVFMFAGFTVTLLGLFLSFKMLD